MITEPGLTRNQMIAELTRSVHGDLKAYLPVGRRLFEQDPDFGAHLIAWDRIKGQVRDAKVALPVISLATSAADWTQFGEATSWRTLAENALAHLALLDPRNLVRALAFAREITTPGNTLAIRRTVEAYLRARENNWPWWERTAMQHRASMKTLYALGHLKPSAMADLVLFKNQPPKGTVFEEIRALRDMSAVDAVGVVIRRKIPFLVAQGVLGAKLKEPDVLMAVIQQMSPTEVVTNAKMLERLGVKLQPATRAAFEDALSRVSQSKTTTFKAQKAVDALDDEGLKDKLRAVQEKQIDALGGVEGDWLVLGDKSGSMEEAIGLAREVAATLTRVVKGKVNLIFFNTSPQHVEATGKTLEELKKLTARITAGGGTSIGCAMQYASERGFEADGIAIVSDGAENTPPAFVDAYNRYCAKSGKEPTVYLYWTKGEKTRALQSNMHRAGVDLQVLDLTKGTDFYALPNLVQTMRTNRYSLGDEVMATPLLTLDDVFKRREQVA